MRPDNFDQLLPFLPNELDVFAQEMFSSGVACAAPRRPEESIVGIECIEGEEDRVEQFSSKKTRETSQKVQSLIV